MYSSNLRCSCCGEEYPREALEGSINFPTRLGMSRYHRYVLAEEDVVCPECHDGWLRPIEEELSVRT
jgi:hypothetical protein